MSFVTAIITNYFLRIYSKEMHGKKTDRYWTPYNEAVLQTTMLVSFPIVAIVSTSILIMMKRIPDAKAWLLKDHYVVLGATVALILFVANLVTRRLCKSLAEDLDCVSRFNTPRDRALSHVVFFAVLLGSLAVPFVCAALMS